MAYCHRLANVGMYENHVSIVARVCMAHQESSGQEAEAYISKRAKREGAKNQGDASV